MAEIELRNVSKRYPGTTAVRHVSFTIHDGEFFILVGPSGCGKSTLLNMIVGLETVSEGEIRVDGRVVNDLDPRERNMAMVFQSYALYPHLSVRENIAFPLKLARLPKEEIDRRVLHAAEILELEEILDRKPRALSGGQRQRVAMGRAIVREPRAFLLDEPLSNLDAKLRVQMRTEIFRLQRRLGTTTVYVTHDQTEAMTLGDRIAVLHKGQVMQIGSPRQLYERPGNLFVAGFVGSPAMNFLPARWIAGRLELPIGTLAFPAGRHGYASAIRDKPLIAGIRPEHLRAIPKDALINSSFRRRSESRVLKPLDPDLHRNDGNGINQGFPKRNEEPGCLYLDVQAEVVEWLGSDLFVHFDVTLEGFEALQLPEDLGLETVSEVCRSLVARIDPTTGVREGDSIRLCLDPLDIQVFDASSGENLTLSRLDNADGIGFFPVT